MPRVETKIKISSVALFECEKVLDSEKNVITNAANLVGDKVFNLQDAQYKSLEKTLEHNIKKKLSNSYCKDLSKTDKKEVFTEELFPEITSKGRKAISVIFDLQKEEEDAILNKLLNSEGNEFRKECAKFANRYLNYKKDLRGILGIIQFELVSREVLKFISIITADFQSSAVSTDPDSAIKDLDNVFDKNFKTIIIYPFLTGRKGDIFFISTTQAKVHEKTILSDPGILISAELDTPDFPQKILEDFYEKGAPSLEEVFEKLGEDYSKKAKVTLKIGSNKLQISFYDFIKHFDIIHEDGGQGLFLHGKEVDVEISGHDLLRDRRIRKIGLGDLIKKLKNKEDNKN
ncbi:hypothetical protein K9L16_03015 [Candidatus Pacearchaeota archaeon]|nr:hypothetical protein [Candidatus Pacearchaeota archaeon]